MGSSATKSKPSTVFQGERGFSRKSKCGNGEHNFWTCLEYVYVKMASMMHTEKTPVAMLVDLYGRKPGDK